MTSCAGSSALLKGMLVPYVPSLPFGSSPFGPSKHTKRRFAVTSVTPHSASKIRSGTPVQSEFDNPAAPHPNPIVFSYIFCSFLRFPAHTSKHGIVIAGLRNNASIPYVLPLPESLTSTLTSCASHAMFCAAP